MTMVGHCGYLDGIPTGPVVDEDFDDILNFLDFPLESLEEDGQGVEWDASESKFLGPIPMDALMAFPPVPQGNIGNGRVKAEPNSNHPVSFQFSFVKLVYVECLCCMFLVSLFCKQICKLVA